jgi:hypothetical protein
MKVEVKEVAFVSAGDGGTRPVWMWAISVDGDWYEAYRDEETAREKAQRYLMLGDLLATMKETQTTD